MDKSALDKFSPKIHPKTPKMEINKRNTIKKGLIIVCSALIADAAVFAGVVLFLKIIQKQNPGSALAASSAPTPTAPETITATTTDKIVTAPEKAATSVSAIPVQTAPAPTPTPTPTPAVTPAPTSTPVQTPTPTPPPAPPTPRRPPQHFRCRIRSARLATLSTTTTAGANGGAALQTPTAN